MRPEQIAELILDAHISENESIEVIDGFRLEPQLGYSGLMAKGAYEKWKIKNRKQGRSKVGCFDFKIFKLSPDNDEVPVVHTRVINEVREHTNLAQLERIINGEDPHHIADNNNEYLILREAQLSMLEQEINWGDEVFQTWSNFLPSKGKRPRDFITAYLRRVFHEPDFIDNMEIGRAASGTFGVITKPPLGPQWAPFREQRGSTNLPWLHGQLLTRFRDIAENMDDNPNY